VLLDRWIAVTVLGLALGGSGGPAAAKVEGNDAQSSLDSQTAAYGHLMRAVLAARRGEFGAASTEIQGALEARPDSPELMVEAAELLAWTGRTSQAERLVRQALEVDPEHSEALSFLGNLLLGRALASEEDVESRVEALEVFEKLASDEETADVEVLTRLVQLRHRSGDLDGAIDAARRMVELRPGDSTAARTLAQLLLQKGEELEATEVLLVYVASHPTAEDLVLFGEQLAHNLEAWGTVVETLGEQGPFPIEATVVHRLLGESYLRLGRMEEAAATLERAREGSPDDLRVRNQLAMAYRGVGRMADAASTLSEMIEESPDFPSFRQFLAETLEFQGDAEGALASYATALGQWEKKEDVAPVRDAVRHRMAVLYLGDDDFEAAREILGEVENPDGALNIRIRGRLGVESETWDEVRRSVRRLRALDQDGLATLLEGEMLARQGRWSKAEDRFDEAVELLGEDVRRRIAEIYRTEEQPEQGRILLKEWVDGEPENADARFLFGEYLYLIDRFEEAEPELRTAFDLDPEHAAALNFLGYSYAERTERLDEALDLVERAIALDSWNGAYLDSLGWVYYQMGRYDEARGPLERAAREMPKDPTILEHLGDVYSSLGERNSAWSAWQRALDAGAEDPAALREKLQAEPDPFDAVEEVAEDDEETMDPGADTSSLIPPR